MVTKTRDRSRCILPLSEFLLSLSTLTMLSPVHTVLEIEYNPHSYMGLSPLYMVYYTFKNIPKNYFRKIAYIYDIGESLIDFSSPQDHVFWAYDKTTK